jgi:integrase
MNTVEPIRNREVITAIKEKLRSQPNPRDYLLFTMGINSALRIGDLLKLKVSDVLDEHGAVKAAIYLRQSKTGKEAKVLINRNMREALNLYFDRVGRDRNPDQYLFVAEHKNTGKPLSKTAAWMLVKDWTQSIGLNGERYGCHSLRKTWGYHARKAGIDINLISEKLGQASPNVTRRYIGIVQDEINEIEDRINL